MVDEPIRKRTEDVIFISIQFLIYPLLRRAKRNLFHYGRDSVMHMLHLAFPLLNSIASPVFSINPNWADAEIRVCRW